MASYPGDNAFLRQFNQMYMSCVEADRRDMEHAKMEQALSQP